MSNCSDVPDSSEDVDDLLLTELERLDKRHKAMKTRRLELADSNSRLQLALTRLLELPADLKRRYNEAVAQQLQCSAEIETLTIEVEHSRSLMERYLANTQRLKTDIRLITDAMRDTRDMVIATTLVFRQQVSGEAYALKTADLLKRKKSLEAKIIDHKRTCFLLKRLRKAERVQMKLRESIESAQNDLLKFSSLSLSPDIPIILRPGLSVRVSPPAFRSPIDTNGDGHPPRKLPPSCLRSSDAVRSTAQVHFGKIVFFDSPTSPNPEFVKSPLRGR